MNKDIILLTIDEMKKLNGLDRSIALTNRNVWLEKERKQDREDINIRLRKAYNFKNRIKHRIDCKAYYFKNRIKHRIDCKKYREKNSDKLKQYAIKYYKKNKEKILQRQKDWRTNKKGEQYGTTKQRTTRTKDKNIRKRA